MHLYFDRTILALAIWNYQDAFIFRACFAPFFNRFFGKVLGINQLPENALFFEVFSRDRLARTMTDSAYAESDFAIITARSLTKIGLECR